MSQEREAHVEGMRFRRDNVTSDELDDMLAKGTGTYNVHVIRGWQYMDQLILGLDMLEGRA